MRSSSAAVGPAGAEQRRQHERLDRPDEQQHRRPGVAAGEPPERRRPTPAARGSQITNSASRQNGAMTSTGPIAATADASTWRLRRREAPANDTEPDRLGADAILQASRRLLSRPSAASEPSAADGRARPRRRRSRRARRRAGRCGPRARRNVSDDTAPRTPRASASGGSAVAVSPAAWAARIRATTSREVDLAALAQQRGVAGVAALDVEQREVAGVLDVEAHAGLGALADPGQRVGVGIHRLGLGLAQPQAHAAHELGEQLLLGREVPVEEALGHAGPPADVLDARGRVAVGGEQLGGGVDQLLLALAPVLGVATIVARRPGRGSAPARRRSCGRVHSGLDRRVKSGRHGATGAPTLPDTATPVR